jgi:hypothetical protein
VGGGSVSIPRTERRNGIADAGLVGKVEFRSDMCNTEVRQQICRVFATAMNLEKFEIDEGKLFPFHYLQRIGPGSRTLCVPTVSSDFEWDGKQVATLAKSGGMIYILADSILSQVILMIPYSLYYNTGVHTYWRARSAARAQYLVLSIEIFDMYNNYIYIP